MNDEQKAESNHPNADLYLRGAGKEFSASPKSGLYKPNSWNRDEQVNHEVKGSVAEPVRVASERQRHSTWQDTVIALATFISTLIAFFTLIGLIVTACIAMAQWQEMDAATRASQKSADAASKSVSVASHAMRLDERAWVAAYDAVTEKSAVGNSIYFKILFRNTGRTLAFKAHAFVNIAELPQQIPRFDKEDMSLPTFVMAPNGTDNISSHPVSQVVAKKIMAGGKVYVFGTIWYSDIFGAHHWIQFCLMPGSDLKGFGACPKHNGSGDAPYK